MFLNASDVAHIEALDRTADRSVSVDRRDKGPPDDQSSTCAIEEL